MNICLAQRPVTSQSWARVQYQPTPQPNTRYIIDSSSYKQDVYFDEFSSDRMIIECPHSNAVSSFQVVTIQQDVVSEAITKMKNLDILNRISQLRKNWNGYGADPIPTPVVDFVRGFIQNSKHIPHISPTADDSIQLEYHKGSYGYLEFSIHCGLVSVYSENEQGEENEEDLLTSDSEKLERILDEFFSRQY